VVAGEDRDELGLERPRKVPGHRAEEALRGPRDRTRRDRGVPGAQFAERDLERAEQTRTQAERELAEYREQLAKARQESNGIIEEARTTAERLRAEIQARAEREAAATVAKAQDEIRAERDRVFQELRGEIGEIAVELAGRVVGASLDATAHQRLIDEYIDQVSKGVAPNGKH